MDYQLIQYINGLMQERCDSIALAMELYLSCINPSISSPGTMMSKDDSKYGLDRNF